MSTSVRILFAVVLVAALVAGCSAPAPASPTAAPKPAAAPTTAPAAAAPAPTKAPAAPAAQATSAPAAAAPAKIAPVKMKVVSYGAQPDYPQRWVAERAMALMTERSGGAFTFEYFPHQTLLKANEVFNAVKANTIQIGGTFALYEPERMGFASQIAIMPFRAYDVAKMAKLAREPGGFVDFYQPYWEKNGIHHLSMPVIPFGELYTRKPVQKLEDMKGLMLRVPDSIVSVPKMLGGTSVNLALGDVYTGIERGTIDGNTGSIGDYISTKTYEVAPYLAKVHIYTGQIDIVMNKGFYDALPAESKALVTKAYVDAEQEWYAKAMAEYDRFLATGVSKGVKVWEPSATELKRWQTAVEPWYDEMKKKYPADFAKFEPLFSKLMYVPQ